MPISDLPVSQWGLHGYDQALRDAELARARGDLSEALRLVILAQQAARHLGMR